MHLETKAKVDLKSNEFDNETYGDEFMHRRIRPAIADLSEYGKRYKGKNVTRKEMLNSEDEIESDQEEDEISNEEDEDEDVEEESDEDDEMDAEDHEEKLTKSSAKKKLTTKSETSQLNLINLNHNEEIAKGKAVKNQLSMKLLIFQFGS